MAGTDKAKNNVVLGLMAGWFGFTPEALLAGHPQEVLEEGRRRPREEREGAFLAGRQYAEAQSAAREPAPLAAARHRGAPKLLTDGNEMCGAAAIFAGCTFFGGYPITPSTEIMQYLGREIWKYGGVVLQAEDEIAGVGAVVGASFAGKKAMTATSGPGHVAQDARCSASATIAELPLVCVNVQRGGPSTGIPTKSEQSDLFQAAFSAHGDVVRPVLAPTTVADMFATTVEAFNIAEEYQTPVIVLSDGDIGAAQGDRRPDRHRRASRSSSAASRRGRELEQYQRFADHRVRRQPDQRARHAEAATTWPPGSSTTRWARRRRAARSTRG